LTFNNVPLTGALTLDLTAWGDGFAYPLSCATYVIPSGTKHLIYTENDPET